ncbi:PREDICTED: regenerating islet-derived protein 3-alpha-like, partial [Chrysochloris asiatica]|uniref:Regenerating islet-derived protein 3-alpha-like n=1 Tax=Chrysochloris asiatica TaxID=185453 RepID=A0A9B0X4B8_CHRAS
MLPSVDFHSMYFMLLSCLMLGSQVQGEDSQMENPSSRISCPRGSKAFGSYCYALFLTARSWPNAEIACQKRSEGHLASVQSSLEGSFVSSLVKTITNTYANIWIGLHYPTHVGEQGADSWEWTNDDLMSYTAWERDPSTIS